MIINPIILVSFDSSAVRCDKEDYFPNKILHVFKPACRNFKKQNLSSVGFAWEIIAPLYRLSNEVITFETIRPRGLSPVIHAFSRVNKGAWSRCVRLRPFYLSISDWSL